VSELARVFEEVGFSTTGLVLLKEHAMKVKPPRMLAVPFNFGNTLGEANNPKLQNEILNSSLELLKFDTGPVLKDYLTSPISNPIVQGSEVKNNHGLKDIKLQDEIVNSFVAYESWLNKNGNRTGVGLSGVDYIHFPELVDSINKFIQEHSNDIYQRPKAVSLGRYLRYVVDDLKAFSFEAKMAKETNITVNDLHKWFWQDTTLARLIMTLVQYMKSHPDPEVKEESFGIAR
tara:strand:- start:2937 stop:3632 length:696 start_codon:yes stop_codon:yes gene_type:complete